MRARCTAPCGVCAVVSLTLPEGGKAFVSVAALNDKGRCLNQRGLTKGLKGAAELPPPCTTKWEQELVAVKGSKTVSATLKQGEILKYLGQASTFEVTLQAKVRRVASAMERTRDRGSRTRAWAAPTSLPRADRRRSGPGPCGPRWAASRLLWARLWPPAAATAVLRTRLRAGLRAGLWSAAGLSWRLLRGPARSARLSR